MAGKRLNLNKNCFFVLSGLENSLGKVLAIEMCRRFQPQSLALLIDTNEELLQEAKKEIQYLNNDINVITYPIKSWQQADRTLFAQVLGEAKQGTALPSYELAFIVHNEGTIATRDLIEPQEPQQWHKYVQQHLYAAVALNQQFLQQKEFQIIEKLVLNITSSLLVQPIFYHGVHGSCLKARNMYFRAMAAAELENAVAVLSFSPGILSTHLPQTDMNKNMIDLMDLKVDPQFLNLPRVKPLQSILKLINILEKISFISGHDVDYYDTFNL